MKNKFLIFTLYLVAIVVLVSCADKKTEDPTDPDPQPAKSIASCEGCHTNYTTLKSNFTPDPPAEGGGCGGDSPHFEPYDRVYLGGDGYQTFKNNIHGKMPCVTCHNGVDGTSDKAKAHSGNFIKNRLHEAMQNVQRVIPISTTAQRTVYMNRVGDKNLW